MRIIDGATLLSSCLPGPDGCLAMNSVHLEMEKERVKFAVVDTGDRFDPIESRGSLGQLSAKLGSALSATHRPYQGLGRVDSDIESAGYPLGQVAGTVGGGHLGIIEKLQCGDLGGPVAGDLLLLADQDLLERVDAEVEVVGGECRPSLRATPVSNVCSLP